MKPDSPERARIRKDPAVREIIRAWRSLTGGADTPDSERRTLVACSGGADSSALAIALAAAAPRSVVIAHVVHDMRPLEQAHADRDAAENLARRLGVRYFDAFVRVRSRPGNAESDARLRRYATLVRIARARRCPHVATGHQADDLAETVIMRLLAGAGPLAMSGIREKLALDHHRSIIRPMLGVTRADSERICGLFNWTWAVDATNADTSRLRSAVRHRVIPILKEISPRVLTRIRCSSSLLADAGRHVRSSITELLFQGESQSIAEHIARDQLRGKTRLYVGEVLRGWYQLLTRGRRLRRISFRALAPVIAAVQDNDRRPREFTVGFATFLIHKDTVTLTPATNAPEFRTSSPPE
ncbi:MAG: tRNA lysidine(34) synthetase TilS [Planctomycetes bacterium]|nr:tRNA lysidine(34) synthetase TilS [Planctomycetota bacterium]